MAVIDVMTYNGEREMLDLHLHELDKYVDRFIIVEAKTTFSGFKKPLYFSRDEMYFRPFWRKLTYHIVDERYTAREVELAAQSPNTRGASHWQREFLQKESIKKALKACDDDDTVYIGDVDEIWEPWPNSFAAKLKLRVYAYYLDNRSNEEFWGTLVARWGDIKRKCLNHMRTDESLRTREEHGWHFTSMGGVKEVQRKLNDSYTTESYNTYQVQELLSERVKKGIDYLGRPFEYRLDRTEWPPYLAQHPNRYQSLMRDAPTIGAP